MRLSRCLSATNWASNTACVKHVTPNVIIESVCTLANEVAKPDTAPWTPPTASSMVSRRGEVCSTNARTRSPPSGRPNTSMLPTRRTAPCGSVTAECAKAPKSPKDCEAAAKSCQCCNAKEDQETRSGTNFNHNMAGTSQGAEGHREYNGVRLAPAG